MYTSCSRQAQKLTKWVARPLVWNKQEFQALVHPKKDSGYCDSNVCIDEVDAILTPSPDYSTWLYEESEIMESPMQISGCAFT